MKSEVKLTLDNFFPLGTISDTANSANLAVWAGSEIAMDHPKTFYGKTGEPVTNMKVDFQIYAVMPDGTTSSALLTYAVVTLPKNGK